MEQITRLYISGIVSKTVAKSQMVSWSELLATRGIKTYFILIIAKKQMDLDEILPVIQPYKIITYPSQPFIREIIVICKLFRIINSFTGQGKLLIQTRIHTFGAQLILLKALFKIKIISDFRGIGEELFFRKTRPKPLNALNSFVNNYLLGRFSDARFFVSERLKNQYRKQFRIRAHKNYIIPGAADSNIYYFDEGLREEMRFKYGIKNNEIVVLYSGKLDKPWQIPESIFAFYDSLCNNNNTNFKIILVIITPDVDIAKAEQNKFSIPDNQCVIKEAETSELNGYYNFADFGLMLRRNHIVNETASPTKFAEYLATGLKVLITEKLGDYSDLVNTNESIGIILNWRGNGIQIDNELVKKITTLQQVNNRQELSVFTKETLSKQVYLEKISSIYKLL